MKLIKLALISIVLLFIVVTGVSLMIPSHVRISRAMNIHASASAVLKLISDTSQWASWNPPFMPDTSGRAPRLLKATKIKQSDSELVFLLRQPGKKPVTSVWKIYSSPAPSDSITLQWYIDLNTSWYPWQKLGTMLYEPTFGNMMQQGLTNIRNMEQGTAP